MVKPAEKTIRKPRLICSRLMPNIVNRLSGKGSRTKDLVDILLLAELGELDGKHLWDTLKATFEFRQTHPVPKEFPNAPSN